jgi:hypothetical protein
MKLSPQKAFFVVLCLLLKVSPAIAEESKDYHLHGYLSLRLEENYIAVRSSRLVHDDAMLWSELNLELPKGFFMNIWHSVGLDDNELSSNDGDEIDITAGITRKIFDFDVSLSCTFFNLYKLGDWSNNNVMSDTIKISKEFYFKRHTIIPELWVEWVHETDKFNDGAIELFPNITHVWNKPFSIEPFTFFHKTIIVWDDGHNFAGNSSDGVFLRWCAGLDWSINKHIVLTLPGFTGLKRLTNPHDGRGDEHSWNLEMKLLF